MFNPCIAHHSLEWKINEKARLTPGFFVDDACVRTEN